MESDGLLLATTCFASLLFGAGLDLSWDHSHKDWSEAFII